MFGLQSALAVLIIGALSTGYFYVQTVRLEADLAKMETKLQASEQLSTTLKTQINEQSEVIQQFKEIQASAKSQIQQLTQERDEANGRTSEALQQIAALRSTEKKWALQDPYATGNRAFKRLDSSMRRIAGETDNNH